MECCATYRMSCFVFMCSWLPTICTNLPPLDAASFVPLAGASVVDSGVAGPAAASAYKVSFQVNSAGVPSARPVNGAIDMGAVER